MTMLGSPIFGLDVCPSSLYSIWLCEMRVEGRKGRGGGIVCFCERLGGGGEGRGGVGVGGLKDH